MYKLKLIHWKPEEAERNIAHLEGASYQVDTKIEAGSRTLRQLGKNPPDAILIDLSRLPSQGRDFALMIRKRKSTRNIPLVFIGGAPEKVEGIRKLMPDAAFTSWEEIIPTLASSIANPPADPIVHDSTFAGYAGKPLPEKLGIKKNMSIALVHPPTDYVKVLEGLPAGVQIHTKRDTRCDLTIWFSRSVEQLAEGIQDIVSQSLHGPVWIAWPKRDSGYGSDLTQQTLRQVGFDHNLVDYKICSIDETWSGLLFKHRENK